jgi:hypothetical protein
MVGDGWSLEVVRGRAVGRVYPLSRGSTVLGNALEGRVGIDLAHQEGDAPRRMAARQTQLDCSAQGLSVRDLDSPGGTFVNRQRLLPGQARALQPGDVLQLGGVQLRVVAGSAPGSAAQSAPKATAPLPAQAPSRPGNLPSPFILASGATCRSWDDFLTVSAQRWAALRDELTSGRLAQFLASIHRPDLTPRSRAAGSADEQLDAWLAMLPTTRPSRPELDVHPERLPVRAIAGGVTRKTIQITNTGYRLLRSTVRIEPPEANWIQVASEWTRQPFVTVERTDLPIDVHIPEALDGPMAAALVIDGNGGTKRVEIVLERPALRDALPEPAYPAPAGGGFGLRAAISRLPLSARLAIGGAGGLALRLAIVLAGWLLGGSASAGEPSPRLDGAAVVLAVLGGLAAATFAWRRGEPRDVPPAGFAGACAGVLAAAVLVALCRSIEPTLGLAPRASPLAAGLAWAVLGTALAAVSAWLVPYRPAGESSP